MAARLGRSFDLYGVGYQVDEDLRDGRPRRGVWAAVVSFWVLAVRAFIGQRRASRFGRLLLWVPVGAVLLAAVSLNLKNKRPTTPTSPSPSLTGANNV